MSVRMDWDDSAMFHEINKVAADIVFETAEAVLEEANRIVPHDQGTLQNSGETRVDESDLTAFVKYDTPYALRLHEHPEYEFQNGREGKWLEKTINEHGKRIFREISNAHEVD